MTRRIGSYREFWPYYLGQHAKAGTRGLHLLGTGLGLVLFVAGIAALDWRLLLAVPVAGYGFAWAGHVFVERNRPASFGHPLWSLVSDLRMFFLWTRGRLKRELDRHGID